MAVPWRETSKSSPRFYGELFINLLSPLPYALEKYRSLAMRQAVERELGAHHYEVVVCDFLAPSVNLLHRRGCAMVLFQHNVESLIWRRHYQTAASLMKRAYFYRQWQKMYRYEREACRRFDAVIAVSAADRDLMREEFGVSEVYDVPTGVDLDYFQPRGGPQDRFGLVFTGSMDWMPNEDAMIYFAEQILPRLARELPEVTLTVVGRNPTRRVEALALADRRIRVTGRVDDIRPYLDRAAAYVVPIRVGGGTRLKIYEAMAMEKPVISTTIGAEGLPVRDGAELLIADDPVAFARAVLRVLTDDALATQLGHQARGVVCERFGWGGVAAAFAQVCEQVAKPTKSQRSLIQMMTYGKQ